MTTPQQVLDDLYEEFLDDPFLRQKVIEYDDKLAKGRPDISFEERAAMVVNYVRRRHGTATERTIRQMRQNRGLSKCDTDSLGDDPDLDAVPEVDQMITADRTAAIAGLRNGRRPQEVKIDKASFNEMELRRRQRGDNR
jgi:hypothetical protein